MSVISEPEIDESTPAVPPPAGLLGLPAPPPPTVTVYVVPGFKVNAVSEEAPPPDTSLPKESL